MATPTSQRRIYHSSLWRNLMRTYLSLVVFAPLITGNTRPLRQSYACEGSTLNIKCDNPGEQNQRTRIVRANYGRFSVAVCNPDGVSSWSTKCMSHTSLQVLTERCTGRPSCSVEVADKTFGDDPCPDTFKYLEVHYECVADASLMGSVEPFPMPTSTAVAFQSRVFAITTPSTTTKAATTSTTTSTATTTTPPRTTTTEELITETTTATPGEPLIDAAGTQSETVPSMDTPESLPGQFAQNNATQATEFCPPVERQGIMWPKTPRGATAFAMCPDDSKGYAEWSCGHSSPPRWRAYPDFTQCTSPWMEDIRQKSTTDLKPEDLADELAELTANHSLSSGGDISSAVDLITKIVNRGHRALGRMSDATDDEEDAIKKGKQLGTSVLKAGSNLLDNKHDSSWGNLSIEMRSQTATSLIVSLETTAFMLAENVPVGNILLHPEHNVVLAAGKFQRKHLANSYKFPRNREEETVGEMDLKNSIELTKAALQQYSRGNIVKVVFLSYKNVGQYLEAVGDVQNIDNVREMEGLSVNSRVISASIDGMRTHGELKEPVIITLGHILPVDSRSVCAFWDYKTEDGVSFQGKWSSRGCWTVSSDKFHTVCACKHLTNFAVLMDVSGTIATSTHNDALTKITFVGCSISIFCLALTLIIFCSFRSLQSERTTIHKNLAFCLMIAEIFFLAGISQTHLPIGCHIFSAIMHYFFLATFAWSLFEGVNLWLMLVEVFESEKSRRVWYYLGGYGGPLTIVTICLAVDWTSYATPNYCWLRADNYFILSFVIPVGLIVMANVFFLSVAMYYMCRNHGLQTALHARDANTWKHLKTWISGAIGLTFIMSITWVFGFLYVGNLDTVIFAYIFTFFNSFQGVFIFVLVCLRNDKVKVALRQFISSQAERLGSSLCTRSSSGYSDSDGPHRQGFYQCSPPLDKEQQYIHQFGPYCYGQRQDMSRRNTTTSTLPPNSPAPVPQCTCDHDFPEKGSTRSSNRDSGHESVSCPSAESPPIQPNHIHQRTLYPPSVARQQASQVLQKEYPATAARVAARNAKHLYGDRVIYCGDPNDHIYAEIDQSQIEEEVCPYSESDESNTSTYQRGGSDVSTDEDRATRVPVVPCDILEGRRLPVYHPSNCNVGSEHKPLINSIGRLPLDPLIVRNAGAFRSLSSTNPHRLRQVSPRLQSDVLPFSYTNSGVMVNVLNDPSVQGNYNAFGLTSLGDGSKMVRRMPLMPKNAEQSLSYSEC